MVALSEGKTEELGTGQFGWVPKTKELVMFSKVSGLSCDQLISEKLQGVHLLMVNAKEIDAKPFEDDRKEKESKGGKWGSSGRNDGQDFGRI